MTKVGGEIWHSLEDRFGSLEVGQMWQPRGKMWQSGGPMWHSLEDRCGSSEDRCGSRKTDVAQSGGKM